MNKGLLVAVPSIPDIKPTLTHLAADLEIAKQAHAEVLKVVDEAHEAETVCLEAISKAQQAIDDWYAERHTGMPRGTRWDKDF